MDPRGFSRQTQKVHFVPSTDANIPQNILTDAVRKSFEDKLEGQLWKAPVPPRTSPVSNRGKSKRAKLSCQECGRTFSTTKSFEKHAKSHIITLVPCRYATCNKSFAGARQLQEHVNKAHGSKKLIKETPQKKGTKRQRENKRNSGNQVFECVICHKQFPKQLALNGHMRSHIQKKLKTEVQADELVCSHWLYLVH